jgi:hypothetical protein
MPIAIAALAFNVLLIVHVVKTGRVSPWLYIIVLLPMAGGIAYLVVVLVPEWLGSRQGQQTQQRVRHALDPERDYRAFSDELEITDTIANRSALAGECLDLGKFDEAKRHYGVILARPNGDEPIFHLGLARAEFGLGNFAATLEALDKLREKWPDHQTSEGHLIYARALEEAGRLDDAADEYKVLADYYPGAEARVRYALLLRRMGRETEAQALLNNVLTQMRRAPKYVRKLQSEWIALAEKSFRV